MSSISNFALSRYASVAGCTVDDVIQRHANGQHWCNGCRVWMDRSRFGRRKDTATRLAGRCRECEFQRVHGQCKTALAEAKRAPDVQTHLERVAQIVWGQPDPETGRQVADPEKGRRLLAQYLAGIDCPPTAQLVFEQAELAFHEAKRRPRR